MNLKDAYNLFSRLEKFLDPKEATEGSFNENHFFYSTLADITNDIKVFETKFLSYSCEEILHNAIIKIFILLSEQYPDDFFLSRVPFSMLVECCAYFISCLYIHNSDKKSGITNIDYVNKHFGGKTSLQCAADNFRKYRSNLYKTRKFKLNKNCKYTILKDYKHEWKLYFHFLDMSPNDKLLITFNRLKSLSSNIFRLENYSFTSNYNTDYEKLLTFYQRCNSLQKKIDFSDFLSLYKFILAHIKSDEKYLGINMFR